MINLLKLFMNKSNMLGYNMCSCTDFVFFKHPREVNMSYSEHMCFSCGLGCQFLCASVQAFVHGIFPCAFQTSSTDYAKNISEKIECMHSQDLVGEKN